MNDFSRRVGINALFLEPGMGGLETYVREVVPRLARASPRSEFTLIVNSVGRNAFDDTSIPRNLNIWCPPLIGRRGLRAVSEMTVLGAIASRRFDVLLSVALTAPLMTRAVNVVLLADVTWLIFPDLADDGGRTLALWRSTVPVVARRADRVIALTESGADDIAQRIGVRRSTIDAVPLGRGSAVGATVSTRQSLEAAFGIRPGPIVLNVAAKKAHKNLLRLVDAMVDVHAAAADAQLVLPGAPTTYEGELRKRAREHGIEHAVHFPGFVSHEDLEGLYAAAACFAFPSANEGFGLPVLEAMERGVPVVCANASALPEVAGNAALLVDPADTSALADAISSVLTDPALESSLRNRGYEQAARFSWDRCAEETPLCLQRAVRSRHGE